MASGPTRIALERKPVPHSVPGQRRRLENRSGGSKIGSPSRVLAQNASNSSTASMVALTGFEGAVYTASVRIGTDWYNLIVDTGSTDTWVSCYVYDATRCLETCPLAAVNITYGSGAVCVSTEYQTIKVGTLQKKDYAIGVALNPIVKPGTAKQGGILLGESEGILGLGYPALASFASPVGYMVSFLSSFSVYFAPEDQDNGSFLILDGVDDELIARNGLVPYNMPLKKTEQTTHWTIGLTGFHVDGYSSTIAPCESVKSGSCDAIIDTGTTMLVVPPQVFNTLVNKVWVPAGCYDGRDLGNEGVYICSRSVKLPRLQFTFGTMNFYLDMKDYIQYSSTGSIFAVEIQPTGSLGSLAQSWVLGGTFLKKFYSSYEVSRAVVFYCVEGTTCDQKGSSASLTNDSVLTSTTPGENGSVANEASSPNDQSATGTSSTIVGVTSLPSDKNDNASPIDSTTSSSSGSHHTLTITVIASLAGLALVVLVALIVRKLYRKRRQRQQDSLVGLEMETLASSGAMDSMYASGAALSPTTVAKS